MDWTFEHIISSEKQLREIMGHPNDIVTQKTINYIDENCKAFIENSPFISIATSDLDNNLDVSPKGDPAGFVKILNDRMLAIPERRGNRKADSLRNIIQNPNIGLIFLIPGIRETLRINGQAKIVTDKAVLELLSHKDKLPSFAIIVTVKEAFMHCSKCIVRSKLWMNIDESKERHVPTMGKALVDHAKLDLKYKDLDKFLEEDAITNLY